MKINITSSVMATLPLLLFACNQNIPVSDNLVSGTGKITVNLSNPLKSKDSEFSRFRIKSIDATDVYYGNLIVKGPGIGSEITDAISPNPVRLPDGKGETTLTLANIPSGNNRIISVNPLDKDSGPMASHFSVKGVTNVISGGTVIADINRNTTPTAEVIEGLINLGSVYSSTVDYLAIQTSVNKIINNNSADTNDDIHPSLVNSSAIANFINNNSGALPSLQNTGEISPYRLSPQTISGKINGITYSVIGENNQLVKHIPPTKVICDDPASEAVTVTDKDGNYTISGVTPGTGYKISVYPDYHQEATVSNISSGSTNVNFSVNSENYIQHSISSSTGIRRFSKSRDINIQFIIPNASRASTIEYTSSYRDSVINALNAWERLASDVVAFNILPDIYDNDPNLLQKKTNADIYIEWTKNLNYGDAIGIASPFPNINNTSIPPGVTSFNVNSTMPYNSGLRVAISLGTYDNNSNKVPELVLQSVATHELGHALGLAVYNPGTGNTHPQTNIDDLMYPSVHYTKPTNLNIALRDLNTLRFLYDIPANVTRE